MPRKLKKPFREERLDFVYANFKSNKLSEAHHS